MIQYHEVYYILRVVLGKKRLSLYKNKIDFASFKDTPVI